MFYFDLNRLETSGKEVVFYPYRRAQVYGVIEIKCESSDEIEDYRKLQNRLCKMTTKVFSSKGEIVDIEAGKIVSPDNHTCFMVGDTAIMFSGWTITIGTELVVEN